MDIAALSMAMSSANIGQQVSLALTKKMMDTMEQNGSAMTQMLQTTVAHPTLGKNLDLKV